MYPRRVDTVSPRSLQMSSSLMTSSGVTSCGIAVCPIARRSATMIRQSSVYALMVRSERVDSSRMDRRMASIEDSGDFGGRDMELTTRS